MIINSRELYVANPIKNMLDKKVRTSGVSHGLTEAGYDIRIKQDVRFHRLGSRGPWHSIYTPSEYHYDFCPEWEPGLFTIASAIEEFVMPDDLVGVVHDKSTWARQGLSVFNTVIEPGWKGFLTLELVYHGKGSLHIPAGTGIAQILFSQIQNPSSYDGKYQNQANRPVPSIFEHYVEHDDE